MTLDELIATHAATCPICAGSGEAIDWVADAVPPCPACADRAAAMRAAVRWTVAKVRGYQTVTSSSQVNHAMMVLGDELAAAADKATEGET